MVRFKAEHIALLTEIRDDFGDSLVDNIQAYTSQGIAFTIFDNETPIAICGAILRWEGVADAWFLTTHHIDNCKVHFYREVMKALAEVRREFNLHRMQCSVESDYIKSQKWLESMNFKCEGLMVAFGPNKKDHYRYGLTWHF